MTLDSVAAEVSDAPDPLSAAVKLPELTRAETPDSETSTLLIGSDVDGNEDNEGVVGAADGGSIAGKPRDKTELPKLPSELLLVIMECLVRPGNENRKSLVEFMLASKQCHALGLPVLLGDLTVAEKTFTRKQFEFLLEDRVSEGGKFKHVRTLRLRSSFMDDLEAMLLAHCRETVRELEFHLEQRRHALLVLGPDSLPFPRLSKLVIWPYHSFSTAPYYHASFNPGLFSLPPSVKRVVLKGQLVAERHRQFLEALEAAAPRLDAVELLDTWTPLMPLVRMPALASKLHSLSFKVDHLNQFLELQPLLTSLKRLEISGISGGSLAQELGYVAVEHLILRGTNDSCLLRGLQGSFKVLELNCPRPRLSLLDGVETTKLILRGTETASLLRGFPRGLQVLELREPVATLHLAGLPRLAQLLKAANLRMIVISGGDIDGRPHESVFWKRLSHVIWEGFK